jgi:hypothetical protein
LEVPSSAGFHECDLFPHRVLAVAEQRRWDSARGENGELAFTAPDGRALPAEPPLQMVEAVLESLHEWAAGRGLDLGPDSNLPLWDGARPDYDWAVGALLRAG